MRRRLVATPVAEPVSLAEAKAHLRLEHELDDVYVGALITATREHIEKTCWRGLVTQTWEALLEAFPCGEAIELPYGTLSSVVSVKYLDHAGAEQTMASDQYEADTASVPGRVVLARGASWPSAVQHWNAVRIRYVVGWPAAEVPAPLKQACLLLVSQLYEHRTPEVVGASIAKVQFAVDALLAPYRLVRF